MIRRLSWLSAGFASICAAANAADSPDAAANSSANLLDEVVVTARKRVERAQDVPISMSVSTGEAMENRNTFRVQEILRTMPNVATEVLQPRQASIAIRGIGKTPANDGLESSVGIFLDGVYLGRPGMAITDLIDVERIEVLRGPQGTLFGKNTTAGALNIVTRSPGDAFESWLQGSVGNNEFSQLSAALNAPLIPQRLAFRLTAFDTDRDGLVINDTTDKKLGEFDRHGTRAQLLWTPGENARLRFIAEYNSQDEVGPGTLLVDPGIIMADGSVRPNNFLDRNARAGYTPLIDPFARHTDAESTQRVTTDQAAFSAQADVKLGGLLLTSISAWRKWHFRPQNDGDYTRLAIFPESGAEVRSRQFSQELRVSTSAETKFDFMAGAYFFTQLLESESDSLYGPDASDFMTQGLTPLALDGFHVVTAADPETDSLAAFVQGTWRPTSAWELTAGVRWTTEERAATITRTSSGGAPLPAGNVAANAARTRLGGFVTTGVETDEDFTSGLLSVRYSISEDMMTYLSLSRGAKSGGINVAIVPEGVGQSLDPETANNLEIGWKSQWLGDTLQLNLAGFWMELDDYQTAQRDSARNISYLANAGSVRSRGGELESLYRPVPNLELELSGGWNDATYTSFTNAPCPVETVNLTVCDFTGERVIGAPPWKASAAVRYEIPFGARGHRVFTEAEYTHTAAFNLDQSDYTHVESYGVANLQLGIAGGDDRWRVWVWSRNLLDEEYFTSLLTAGAFNSGAVVGQLGEPRVYGMSVRARF